MKKRNILFALLLALTMLVTACGAEKSVEGKWVGSLDLTKQFTDGVKAGYPDLAEFVAFEDLVIQFDVSFVEDKMSMEVIPDSVDAFNANFAKGMQNMAVSYWEAGLAQINMTLEEAIIEAGMTEEQYLSRIYRETGVDKMIISMSQVTSTTLEKLSGMDGIYTTVANELRLYYEEDKYESMEYGFKGKNLNITIKGDSFSLLIQCEKR